MSGTIRWCVRWNVMLDAQSDGVFEADVPIAALDDRDFGFNQFQSRAESHLDNGGNLLDNLQVGNWEVDQVLYRPCDPDDLEHLPEGLKGEVVSMSGAQRRIGGRWYYPDGWVG